MDTLTIAQRMYSTKLTTVLLLKIVTCPKNSEVVVRPNVIVSPAPFNLFRRLTFLKVREVFGVFKGTLRKSSR